MLGKLRQAICKYLQLKPAYLIVVDVGGSNLWLIAVQEAVLRKLYNQLTSSRKVLCADTVDSDGINNIIILIKPVLKKVGNIVLNVVSKSGTTTETIANAKSRDLKRAMSLTLLPALLGLNQLISLSCRTPRDLCSLFRHSVIQQPCFFCVQILVRPLWP